MRFSFKSCFFVTLFLVILIFLNFSFMVMDFKSELTPVFKSIISFQRQQQQEQVSKKYVYIDLGVGKGFTAYNFFQNVIKTPEIVTLIGEQTNIAAISWDVYIVEANPYFDKDLSEIKRVLTAFNHSVHVLNQTAAWTYDGIVPFYLDTINKANYYWGSSLK